VKALYVQVVLSVNLIYVLSYLLLKYHIDQ
jgi:hypothetical protein